MANLSNINNKFLVTTGGNVGINTTSPNSKLDVTGGDITVNTTGTGFMNFKYSGNSIGSIQTDGLDIKINATSDLVLLPGSNVGIGTTSPSSKLEVKMNDAANNRLGFTGDGSTTGAAMWTNWQTGNSYLDFRLGGTTDTYTKMRITNAGNVGIGTTMNINKLDVAGNINVQGGNGSYLTFNNGDANIVINNNGSGRDLSFKTYDGSSNSERMRIDKDGNLGIGTTSPTARLDVLTNSATGDNSIDRHVRFRADNGEQRFNFFVGRSGNSPNLQMYDSSEVVKIVFNTADNSYFNGGNLGIGTTSPGSKLEVNVSDDTFNDIDVLKLRRTWATGSGTDRAHGISFNDANAVNAAIYADRTNSGSNYKSDLVFITNTGASGTDTSEKMRIDSSGHIYQGTVGETANKYYYFQNSTTADAGLVFKDNASTNSGYLTYNHGIDAMKFATGGTERMRIDSSGNTTFLGNVYLKKASNQGQLFFGTADNQYEIFGGGMWGYIGYNTGGYHRFFTSGTERMRIDSSGNVGIKATSPSSYYAKDLVVSCPDEGGITIAGTTGDAQYLMFADSTSGDARYEGYIEFNHGTNLMSYRSSGEMRFLSNAVERMRITSGGQIEIRNGTTVAGQLKPSGSDNDLAINGKRGQVIFEIADVQKAVLDANQFYPAANNGLNLGTTSLRFSTVFATNGVNTSDETLKENIKECDLGIDFIDLLKPKSYNLKDLREDNDAYDKKRYGLIAQDLLQTELKDSVFGEKDGEYGLSYNDLIAPMIKAIQELKAEIEELKK